MRKEMVGNQSPMLSSSYLTKSVFASVLVQAPTCPSCHLRKDWRKLSQPSMNISALLYIVRPHPSPFLAAATDIILDTYMTRIPPLLSQSLFPFGARE